MQAERWKKIEELYQAAIALSAENRADYLLQACPGDPDLRAEVQSLLAQRADSFLESSPLSVIKTLTPGAKLGNFEIAELIGRGGMGEVYRARDSRLKREVAIKVLPAALARDPHRIARFEREARAAGALNHPNIVAIYETGCEGDTYWIASELIVGESLAKMMQRGPIAVGRAVEIAVQIADGLAAAHAAGIVHRDLKPANVMVTRDGRVKVLDFGLAKIDDLVTPAESACDTLSLTLTQPGKVMGTVPYMSPEQVQGQESSAASDVFSLGIVFYEMIAGRRPFVGDTSHEVMNRIVNGEPPPLRKVRPATPEVYCRVVGKALAKAPSKRYGSGTELLEDLRGAQATISKRHSRRLWLAVGGLFVLLLALLAILTMRSRWFAPVPREKKIVVLPFQNVGGNAEDQALCDGLFEILTSKLTQLEQFQGSVWVVSASEVRAQSIHSARAAQKAFGVNMAISGSLQRVGGQLRLTANLIDAGTQNQLRSLDERVQDISLFQDRVVADIASMLEMEVRPAAMAALSKGKTTVPGAYEFYVQGYGYLRRLGAIANADDAIRLFHQALSADSEYALAHSGMAEAYWRKYYLTKDPQSLQRAKESSVRALQLDDRLAPAHIAFGQILRGTGQVDDAVREFQRATDLDPGNADAWRGLAQAFESARRLPEAEGAFQKAILLRPGYWAGYGYLAAFYKRQGRYADAQPLLEHVIALTPDNPVGYSDLGGVELYLTHYVKAAEILYKGAAIRPSAGVYTNLGNALFLDGRYAEAAMYFEKATGMDPRNYIHVGNLGDAYRWTPALASKAPETYRKAVLLARAALDANPKDAAAMSSLASYLAKLGQFATALAAVEKAGTLAPANADILYQSLVISELAGRREEAFRKLNELLKSNYPADWIRRDPELASLRKDTACPEAVR